MTIERPLLMQKVLTGDPDIEYSARLFRRLLLGNLWSEGVLTGLQVRQRAAGANYTVEIDPGFAVIQGDTETNQGVYVGESTAIESRGPLTMPGTNSRIDRVIARINDPQAGGIAGSSMTFEVVTGTVAGSPVAPAVPSSAISLATIGPLTAGTVSITNALITDTRTFATTVQGPPNDSITAAKIAADAVGTSEIAGGAVGTSEIAAGAVIGAHIVDGAIPPAKMVGLTAWVTDTADRNTTSTTYNFTTNLQIFYTFVSGRTYEVTLTCSLSSGAAVNGDVVIDIGGALVATGRMVNAVVATPIIVRFLSNTLSGTVLVQVGVKSSAAGQVSGIEGSDPQNRPYLTIRDLCV